MTDSHTLSLARQWAADINADRRTLSQDTIDAAADLITSLPDTWVDADDLREYVTEWREGLATAPSGNYESEMLDDLEDMLPVTYPAHECAADVLYSVSYKGAVHTAWRVDNDDMPWIIGTGRQGTTWAADEAVRVLGPVAPGDDGVVDCPVVSDDADDLTALREARADDDGARVTLEQVADEADPAYIYTDRDGDEWECLGGRWITGDTHAERVAMREVSPGRDGLPEEYGPYRKDRLATPDDHR